MIGAKQTRSGRIVYNRRIHSWKMRDVNRIVEKIINEYDEDFKESQVIPINYLYEIVRNGLYPYYLDATFETNVEADQLWALAEGEIRAAWREKTFEICDKIGDNVGIPEWVRRLVIDYLGGYIWDQIWILTGLFFHNDGVKKWLKKVQSTLKRSL
jgi:hypothetical protein